MSYLSGPRRTAGQTGTILIEFFLVQESRVIQAAVLASSSCIEFIYEEMMKSRHELVPPTPPSLSLIVESLPGLTMEKKSIDSSACDVGGTAVHGRELSTLEHNRASGDTKQG